MTFRILVGIGLLAVVSFARADILVTEVMSSSKHPDSSTANDDWFELTNTGSVAVNLTGWTWDDNKPPTKPSDTIGNFDDITSIGAGESIIITGEAKGTEAAWLADWGLTGTGLRVKALGGTIFQSLGADGDSVIIYNQSGTVVTSVTFGVATAGSSFIWNSAGTFLGTSALGQYGAIQAVSDGSTTTPGPGMDIGSPGTVAAVPEPGMVALFTFGLGVVLYGFRRRPLRG